MTRRHIFLLGLALACLYGVVFLQGCAWNIKNVAYEWYDAPEGKLEWYRWVVIQREGAGFLLGNRTAGADGARVVRSEGPIRPGDRNAITGEVATKGVSGRVCIVMSINTEHEAATRWMDQFYERSLRDHEVIGHCANGQDHADPGR